MNCECADEKVSDLMKEAADRDNLSCLSDCVSLLLLITAK